MNLSIDFPDEVMDELVGRASAAVEARLEQRSQPARPRWVDKHGAADFLAFSVSKLEKLTAQNRIPHHHHDGRVHYRTDELDEWLSGR